MHFQVNVFTSNDYTTNILLFLSGGWYVYQQRNEVHNNCGIEIYYQTDMQTTHDNMLLELFCQIISEPCFNTLRTKEQLGEPTKHKRIMENISRVTFSNMVFNILYMETRQNCGDGVIFCYQVLNIYSDVFLWELCSFNLHVVIRYYSIKTRNASKGLSTVVMVNNLGNEWTEFLNHISLEVVL